MDKQAESDSGLRPPQGQSRFWESIFYYYYPMILRAQIFTSTIIRTTWFNTIYEKDTLSR